MPRRKSVNIIRDVGVDPKFKSQCIQKFINIVMSRGKKNIARKIVYSAFDIVSKKIDRKDFDPVSFFDLVVSNVTPLVEVRSRRVGGSVYQVPVEVKSLRGQSLAFKNIINAARSRGGKSFDIKLAVEFLEASENKGGAVKSRHEKHKMADANKAFSHLTW